MIHNKPLLLFFSAFLFAGSALGMWLGLFFIYVDAYLGMGALFAKISLIGLLVSIPGAFVWLKVTNYLDKKYVWLLAMLLGIASFAYTGFLGPENVSYWTVQVLAITYTLCLICVDSVPYSMLSDIVDYSTWKFRTYRGATYFALFVFTYKAAFAVGVALALAITGWYGFDPSSTSQTESSITGLKMAMTWVPILLVMISMVFIALSPITDRRHGVIRRRLNLIEARSKKANRKPRALSRSATESLLMTQSAK